MQYRYHEWGDPILSKRSAEAIATTARIGLKLGFDLCSGRISGSNHIIGISSSNIPSNNVSDRLHLNNSSSNVISTIGSVITPDCVVTTENELMEFTLARQNGLSFYMLLCTHNYIEIRKTETTVQGGQPSSFSMVDITSYVNTITSDSPDSFISDYLVKGTDVDGKTWHPIDAVVSLGNPNYGKHNTVVVGILTIQDSDISVPFVGTYDWDIIKHNKVPLLRSYTEYDHKYIYDSLESLKSSLEQTGLDISSLKEYIDKQLQEWSTNYDGRLSTLRQELYYKSSEARYTAQLNSPYLYAKGMFDITEAFKTGGLQTIKINLTPLNGNLMPSLVGMSLSTLDVINYQDRANTGLDVEQVEYHTWKRASTEDAVNSFITQRGLQSTAANDGNAIIWLAVDFSKLVIGENRYTKIYIYYEVHDLTFVPSPPSSEVPL